MVPRAADHRRCRLHRGVPTTTVSAPPVTTPAPNKYRCRTTPRNVQRTTGKHHSARPGISLTAEYGSDGQICHLLIEPRQSLIHEEQQGVYMSSEAVTEILNEIVPLETRGKETLRAFTSRGGCNRYEFVEYENVSIGRATHNCLPLKSEREMSARVIFKRAICSNLSK